ncbi:MAG TPA: hypothetical protein PKA64_25555 [Myxococcota bacterium]|nr:hypothetical protein [Myxococcota bacterium]
MRVTWIAAIGLMACADPGKDDTGAGGDPPVESDPPEETDPPTDDTPVDDSDTPAPATEVSIVLLDPPSTVQRGRATDVLRFTVSAEGVAQGDLVVTAASDVDGPQAPPTWDAPSGAWVWSTAGLSAGAHVVTLTAVAPDGGFGAAEADLGVCEWPATETYDSDALGADWRAFGDAAWDPSGWMEITGNLEDRRGSIYKVSRKVNPGDLRLEFDIATGGGRYSGGDGYAVNIIDVPDVDTLAQYVGVAAAGGCLGYGVTVDCEVGRTISAFHVEFDTWYNTGDNATDPTSQNHVGVMLDGDPSTHYLWADVFLEDLQWRHVVVEIRGTHVRVDVAGVTVIDGDIPGLRFDGGFLGVSGSTGLATNFHRFDNLRVEDYCIVPDPAP